jgi:hypothetical protein
MSNPDALYGYYSKCTGEVSCHNLLDPIDGGGKCLVYREQNKITHNKKPLNVVHYIQIEDIEELLNSIF